MRDGRRGPVSTAAGNPTEEGEKTPMPVPPLADSHAHKVPCRRCGYDLRGTSTTSRCPECGVPSWVAFAGDDLHYFDPQWLASISLGTDIVQSAIWFALIVFAPTMIVLDYVFDVRGGILLIILPLLALCVGGWVFTTQNPMDRDSEPPVSWRRVVRVCLCTVPLTVVLLLSPNPIIGRVWILLMGAPTGLFGLLGGIALSQYVSLIADRVGDELSS
jgi:hypothetical protein